MIKIKENDCMQSAKKILDFIGTNKIKLNILFFNFLSDINKNNEIAETFDINIDILNFIVHSSLKPSLEEHALKLSSFLNKDYINGCCPICDNFSELSLLEEDGKRSLICSFCNYKWTSQRLFCPFCKNKDNKTLFYSYSEQDKAYRIDYCKKCKKYIKTVDVRKLNHFLYPPLEMIATLHLDLIAQKKLVFFNQNNIHPLIKK